MLIAIAKSTTTGLRVDVAHTHTKSEATDILITSRTEMTALAGTNPTNSIQKIDHQTSTWSM